MHRTPICYVWSDSLSENTCWDDPYTPNNVIVIPVSGSNDKIDTWYTIKRNVFEDFKKYFHETFDSINDIAIMTDTDNSHEKTTAFYRDIFFSK